MRNGRRQRHFDFAFGLVPMIDVMTVLLAVFMVTAPMMTSGIDLDLPKAGRGALSGKDTAAQVSVDKNGNYYLAKTRTGLSELVKKLSAIQRENPKLEIIISGDKGAYYGDVIVLMGALKDSGFSKVGLRTENAD
ncbi:MAG: ExbD/TolR family protein [Rickettsiales bacterium]|jgi:biopolymer transport protein TolR|nr:ExbD/TolR family protein [Rickettsiales bacterium]